MKHVYINYTLAIRYFKRIKIYSYIWVVIKKTGIDSKTYK